MTRPEILAAVRHAIRNPYAWPGGYPKYLIMADGEALSLASAHANYRHIWCAVMNGDTQSDWYPACVAINYEDPALYCAHSNERIESAYAEPGMV
jgi:hypothetical protein